MSLANILDDITSKIAIRINQVALSKTLITYFGFSDDANKANIVLKFENAWVVIGYIFWIKN